MEATLQSLGGILLRAIPTLILLLILHVYLKMMFFKPLQEVLRKRREATEGAREAAEASTKQAAEKAAQYEAQLREARAGIYKEQEEMRHQWLDGQTQRIEKARQKTHEMTRHAKTQIDTDVAAAKQELQGTAESLADRIASTLLEREAQLKRAFYTLLFFAVLTLAAPAQEHEPGKPKEAAGEKEEHGEMMGWKWANFALLAVGLGYFLAKNLPPFFRTRGDEIRQGIDEAAKLKADAEAKAKDIDARLNAIGSDIAKLRDQLKSELAAEGDRLKADTERALARIEDQAQQELAFMTKAARQELKAFSAELALDLAKTRIQNNMNAGVQQRLVDTFIHDLKTAEHGTSVQ